MLLTNIWKHEHEMIGFMFEKIALGGKGTEKQ